MLSRRTFCGCASAALWSGFVATRAEAEPAACAVMTKDSQRATSPADALANTNVEEPVRYTGRLFTRAEVVRRFVFRRTVQLVHSDGLTFDYLFDMARELDAKDSVVLLGTGPKGALPLVFQTNGTPYRAFLEGRVRDDSYQLLMHLSNMELKLPEGAGS